MSAAGIKSPIRLRRGRCGGEVGTFWAWPIDGYYDLHFVADCDGRDEPDGSDCIEELIGTLREARRAAVAEDALARVLL